MPTIHILILKTYKRCYLIKIYQLSITYNLLKVLSKSFT
ncbi:hypothetical protein THERMOT_1384 [Bathymodiolus thermophilus thioautotrophic gill symbiont]|uniref:Uncharacterized protein n=1 Tax=Bathymodiolus thermophilus thioautotrophic gill symbiont TaxID=2360 RepID=A0A8H9CFJ4_9GAMM|nr:hypothetical protein THERMOS_1001 [Bathymodiolus thermophilus thioautotrophic gill symbiont]CAB5501257.1 hypothetical protein THERMOT_1384 [Bathymodiolus thermophilus thioautotrophic gill symbiont]